MNKIKKMTALLLTFILCISWGTQHTKAASLLISVKVPKTAKVVYQGVELSRTDVIKEENASGRIHDIAKKKLGVTCGYYVYGIMDFTNPVDLVVYNVNGDIISPTNCTIDAVDYSDSGFEALVKQRVEKAAIAYHNRVGGYGGEDFGSYILPNSDAYGKCIRSDSGRKWGQYVSAGIITSVKASEICRYTDSAFTARVDITATGDYSENYSIYFLFQKNGDQYYVTDFTY